MCNSFNKRFLEEASKHLKEDDQVIEKTDFHFMKKAIDLAVLGVKNNQGGPFGCVIVKDGEIIGSGYNQVTSNNDPTAHAEIMAIREACVNLESHQLNGCVMYSSCEPCPMCLGAIYWSRPDKVYYAGTKSDAAKSGFDDAFIYEELKLLPEKRAITFKSLGRDEAQSAFRVWDKKDDKIQY